MRRGRHSVKWSLEDGQMMESRNMMEIEKTMKSENMMEGESMMKSGNMIGLKT